MAVKRAPRPAPGRHFAIRLQCKLAPAGQSRRVYLVCGPAGPVAAVSGGPSGVDELLAAGFARCPVEWHVATDWESLRQALGLLPAIAKRRKG